MKCQSSDVSRDSLWRQMFANVSLVTFDFWRNILILLCPKLSWETLLYVLIIPHTIYKSIKKKRDDIQVEFYANFFQVKNGVVCVSWRNSGIILVQLSLYHWDKIVNCRLKLLEKLKIFFISVQVHSSQFLCLINREY